MYIIKSMTHANGAQTMIHRIRRLEVTEANLGYEHVVNALVQVDSYPSVALSNVSCQETIQMPLEAFSAAAYPANVINFLTGFGGYLADGIPSSGGDTPVDLALAQKLARVEVLREEKVAGGFDVEGIGLNQSNPLSVRNIQGKAQRAAVALTRGETDWSTIWKVENDDLLLLNADQMISVGEGLDEHISACYERSWEIKAELVIAATAEGATAADVEAVDLESNWP